MRIPVIIAGLFTVATFGITLSMSCSKDECADVTCQHGGTCKNGVCTCPSGYTGSRCENQTCAVNNTAEVQFSNRSANSTYSIIWDGSIITTLAAGATSNKYIVAAGQHTLTFRYSNTTNDACTQSTPNMAQCSSVVYWCGN